MRKDKIINIIIGIATYVLSLALGTVLGTVALCAGTSWLYVRTNNFWKYTLITTISNFVVSIVSGVCLLNELGIFNTDIWSSSELGTVLGLFIIPCAIILAALLVLAVNILTLIRLGLQYLCYFVIKRRDQKRGYIK